MKKSYSYAPNPFEKMSKTSRKLAVANAIYVVDRDRNGKKISSIEFNKRIREVEATFLRFFGGVTNDEIDHGEFLNSTNNKIISERVARIMSFAEAKMFRKHRIELEKWIVKKKKEWNQEAIAYEFEGDLYYL